MRITLQAGSAQKDETRTRKKQREERARSAQGLPIMEIFFGVMLPASYSGVGEWCCVSHVVLEIMPLQTT